MDTIYFVLPAYNEEANIEDVIKQWHPVCEKINAEGHVAKLVIANDGSKDKTFAIMQKLQTKFPLLKPLDKQNSGHGPSIQAGYKYAVAEGADYIFQTDSDGQTEPSEFPEFWENRRKYEMIIGYRKDRGDGFGRLVVTRVLRLLIFLTFHVYVKDANTPFRLMKASVLEKELKYVPRDYFLTNVLISVIFTKRKYRIK